MFQPRSYFWLSLMVVLASFSQTGCNTIFNPDKTISSALAAFATDSTTSHSGDFEQFVELVDDGNEERIGIDTRITPNETRVEFSDIPNPDSAVQDLTPGRNYVPENATPPIRRHPPERIPKGAVDRQNGIPKTPSVYPEPRSETEQEQKRLIRIYDTINEFDPPPESARSLPPLIQRPLLYDESIVKSPIDADLKSGSASSSHSDISWKDSLEATIDHLQEELKSLDEESAESRNLKKSLKILSSVETDKGFVELADKLESLKKSLPLHQFEAISQLIQATDDQKSNLIDQLRTAVDKVSRSADLSINNVAFCTSVQGFGKFKRFPKYKFKPGDEVLLYCELENFAETQSTERDHSLNKCHFDAQIEFLDENDVTNYVESFANITDECQTDRKDFYLFFRFKIPKLLKGDHRIQIRFNDKIGRKKATLLSPLRFEVE